MTAGRPGDGAGPLFDRPARRPAWRGGESMAMMNDVTSVALAAVLAAGIGAVGYAGMAGSGAAWRDGLAARQTAFREAEAQRIAEAEAAAAEQARLEAEAAAEAASPPPAIEVSAAQGASGGGYDPLAPRGSAGGGYDPLAPSGRAGGGGYDPTAPRRSEPSGPAPDGVALHPEFDLPDTEGVDIVYYSCTACHSASLFSAQRLTPQRWDEVLTWMVETQNMAEPYPEDREIILDYLVRHFSTES